MATMFIVKPGENKLQKRPTIPNKFKKYFKISLIINILQFIGIILLIKH